MSLSLSFILGRALADVLGLCHAHLPEGIPDEMAAGIVRAANSARRSDPPFALLVTEHEDLSEELCPRVTIKGAIRYRQDSHLAVISGRHPDLSSFIQVFKEVLGQSFPERADGPVSLKRLSSMIVAELAAESEHSLTLNQSGRVSVEVIESCLNALRDVHSTAQVGLSSWNALWFQHVDTGLAALQRMLASLSESKSVLSVDEAISKYAHACFALPQPVRLWQARKSSLSDARRLNDSREDYWSDSTTSTVTAKTLGAQLVDVEHHPLESIDMSPLDASLNRAASPWIALSEFFGASLERLDAFRSVRESEFINPDGQDAGTQILRLESQDRKDLALSPGEPLSPAVVPVAIDVLQGGRHPQSEILDVVVPLIATPTAQPMPVSISSFDVQISPSTTAVWVSEGIEVGQSSLRIRGYIRWKNGTGRNAGPFRQLRLALKADPSGPIAPYVRSGLSTIVYSFSSSASFLALGALKTGGALGRPIFLGQDLMASLGSDAGPERQLDFVEELPPVSRGYMAFLWNAQAEDALLDGVKLASHSVWRNLFLTHFEPAGDHIFESGDFTYRIRPVAAESGQQSALLAAALKQQVAPDRPTSSTEESIRGQAEVFYSRRLVGKDPQLRFALGHIMMPSDAPAKFGDLTPQDNGTVLMADAARAALSEQDFADFDHPEFVRGPEVERMRDALDNLHLEHILAKQDVGGSSDTEWLSRSSWRRLWLSDELKEYLDAYRALVSAAQATGVEELVFWATYPMSISVWDVTRHGGCSAVLLSPLHPLRLAWLAGVESLFSNASQPQDFLGSVEGWNFPITGPGNKSSRRMIAVPADAGEGQLFLGWSMMLRAGTDEARQLSAPSQIAGSSAPGTAVSGLNAASVDAALRSFRRMHPHVTTLAVDLSAHERQNRLEEIDGAVLALAEEWGTSSMGELLGGVRVFDSVKRDGSAPRDEVTRVVRNNPDMLLTWSRYATQSGKRRACNVRFLQDSGTTIQVRAGRHSFGSVGLVPLRRFDVSEGRLTNQHVSQSEPGIPLNAGWAPFVGALSAAESNGSHPMIEAGMLRRDLGDNSADWTVVGETFLSPAVIAELMDDRGGGVRMLWEWRPPVLGGPRAQPMLERRPFVSIAQVPGSFGTQLTKLLAKANPEGDVHRLRSSVMSTLGRRGVGLSSLLSMGGTHVAGALGFYLAFALFDRVGSSTGNRLVMPIDASDYFLRVLARKVEHGRAQRRADLLFMELTEDELILVPVEIKSYGLGSDNAGNHLPAPSSGAFKDPLSQLQSSHSLLMEIELNARELEGADAALWNNSMATLVETAARLSPGSLGSVEDLARRLAKVAEGRMNVRVGKPILTYFTHAARGLEGERYYVDKIESEGFQALALVADTQAVFETADLEHESALLAGWRKLVGAAADRPSEVGGAGEREPGGAGEREPGGAGEREPGGAGEREPGILGEGVRISVGKILGSLGSAEADFWPSNTGLNQLNVGIVGDLGTGKTELVKALIAQMREQVSRNQPNQSVSMLILDYKGDFQRSEFLERVGGVVLEPHQIPLNVFLPVTDDYARKPYRQAAAFVDSLGRIYSGIGPVQVRNLNQAIRDCFDERGGEPPTLAEVHARYESMISNPDSILSILDGFVYNEIFSKDRRDLRSFDDLLEGRVLVVALDRLGQDQRAKNALIVMFLNLYFDYMLRSEKLPFQGQNPQLRYLKSFLLVDEAVNIMRYDFEVLMNLMLQGRQFGFGIMLASQYLSHFKEGRVNHGEPLRTWFVHKVPSVTPRELASLGMPGIGEDVARRIPELKQHEVLYKSYGWDEGRFVRATPYYELYGL